MSPSTASGNRHQASVEDATAPLELIVGGIVGDDEAGAPLAMALRMIAMVSPQLIRDGINRINHETSIGPMLNPTAYLSGKRFDNGRKWTDVLRAALELRKAIDRATAREEGLQGQSPCRAKEASHGD